MNFSTIIDLLDDVVSLDIEFLFDELLVVLSVFYQPLFKDDVEILYLRFFKGR